MQTSVVFKAIGAIPRLKTDDDIELGEGVKIVTTHGGGKWSLDVVLPYGNTEVGPRVQSTEFSTIFLESGSIR